VRGIEGLIPIFHRRWAGSVLAELARDDRALAGRSRVGAMAARLGAHPESVRKSIGSLVELGVVERNPGYGHPLRPEYVLSARGRALAPRFLELDDRLRGLELLELAQRKWTLPILYVVRDEGHRFRDIGLALAGVTDRALSMSLKDLCGAGVVAREVVDGAPPRPVYGAVGAGVEVGELVESLVA